VAKLREHGATQIEVVDRDRYDPSTALPTPFGRGLRRAGSWGEVGSPQSRGAGEAFLGPARGGEAARARRNTDRGC